MNKVIFDVDRVMTFKVKQFTCESCNHTSENLDLTRVDIGYCYVKCKVCNAYYKLVNDNGCLDDFYLKHIDKKIVLNDILNIENYRKFTILDV